jgi:hypothetical protein
VTPRRGPAQKTGWPAPAATARSVRGVAAVSSGRALFATDADVVDGDEDELEPPRWRTTSQTAKPIASAIAMIAVIRIGLCRFAGAGVLSGCMRV